MADQPTDGADETTTLEEANAVGYFGIKVDPEDNDVYTFNRKATEADIPVGKKAEPAKSTSTKSTTSSGS